MDDDLRDTVELLVTNGDVDVVDVLDKNKFGISIPGAFISRLPILRRLSRHGQLQISKFSVGESHQLLHDPLLVSWADLAREIRELLSEGKITNEFAQNFRELPNQIFLISFTCSV
jgi:hypothetical protein